ncbi:hypothetical protein B0T16DRAFT_488269 [Cercophora newfieldiana]|uniref:DUF7726 domain-containing protein n=1 Tax=Cercophora newfieldiana TaxID=92897 RepID=A0AA39YR14_9PEZI|nr:hypothetical protein B0T16DRAFT_488269 [Cercophora newfieldiana]
MNPFQKPSARAPLGALPTTATNYPPTTATAVPLPSILNPAPPLNKENAPLAPLTKTYPSQAPIPTLLPTSAGQKRKSLDQHPTADGDDDEDDYMYLVEDLPIDQNCDQVRRKINRFLDAGEMTKTAFANKIGVSMKSLNNFLAEHGANKGSGSASYDCAWAFFKARELKGIKIPNKAQLAKKQRVATAAAAAAAPAAPGAAPAAVPAAAPAKKGAFANGNTSGLDLSTVTLEGEDTDTVPIFDSCDEIRRKINLHMNSPGVTQAQFCRDMLAQFNSPSKPKAIQGTQLARFRGMKGATSGAASLVFYGAYVFFEKVRVKEGKPKTKHRKDMEKTWGPEGVERENHRGGYWCIKGSYPVMDKLGRVSIVR